MGDRAEKARERQLLTCRHFTGIQNKTCGIGIVYDSLQRPLPCLPNGDGQRGECGMRVCYTPEDLAEQDRQHEKMIRDFKTARAAIVAHMDAVGTRKQNTADQIGCPVCGTGTLSYRCAGAYNGHVHAKCSTPSCVAWME